MIQLTKLNRTPRNSQNKYLFIDTTRLTIHVCHTEVECATSQNRIFQTIPNRDRSTQLKKKRSNSVTVFVAAKHGLGTQSLRRPNGLFA